MNIAELKKKFFEQEMNPLSAKLYDEYSVSEVFNWIEAQTAKGGQAEVQVMPKTDRTKTIKHLYDSACGYGFADIMKHKDNSGYEKFASILNAIPEELFSEFIYTLYRIAEKSGDEGFSA